MPPYLAKIAHHFICLFFFFWGGGGGSTNRKIASMLEFEIYSTIPKKVFKKRFEENYLLSSKFLFTCVICVMLSFSFFLVNSGYF